MPKYKVKNFAILASGQGTNAISLIKEGLELGYPPRFIVCNNKDSQIHKIAKEFGVPCYYIEAKVKGVDIDFENRVLNLCKKYKVDWLLLAGFLKILSSSFIKEFNFFGFNQVINIHPSLLPKYPGLGGYKKAFKNNDTEFGHTLHLVTDGVDEGPIIFQKVLTRNQGTSLEEMTLIGKLEENKSYARLLRALVENGGEWLDGKFLISWKVLESI